MHREDLFHEIKPERGRDREIMLRWAVRADVQAIASLEVKSIAFEDRSDSCGLLNEEDLTALWDLRLSAGSCSVILAFLEKGDTGVNVCSDFKENRHEDACLTVAGSAYAKSAVNAAKEQEPHPFEDLAQDQMLFIKHSNAHVADHAKARPGELSGRIHLEALGSDNDTETLNATLQDKVSAGCPSFNADTGQGAKPLNKEGMLSGFIALTEPLSSGQISALYIHPSCMRQGTGSLLINTAARLVALRHGHKLEVKVQMCNKGARLFYETLHFRAYDVKSANQKNLITMLKEF